VIAILPLSIRLREHLGLRYAGYVLQPDGSCLFRNVLRASEILEMLRVGTVEVFVLTNKRARDKVRRLDLSILRDKRMSNKRRKHGSSV
jgi:hypothetical protein